MPLAPRPPTRAPRPLPRLRTPHSEFSVIHLPTIQPSIIHHPATPPLATCPSTPAPPPSTPATRRSNPDPTGSGLPYSDDPSDYPPPVYPSLDTAPFPALLENAEKHLARIEWGLRKRDYRYNYLEPSRMLREQLSLMRSLIAPVKIATHYTTAPRPPDALDFELADKLVEEALDFARRIDRGLRNDNPDPRLSIPLVPLTDRLRAPLHQLAQVLRLPTPPSPNP